MNYQQTLQYLQGVMTPSAAAPATTNTATAAPSSSTTQVGSPSMTGDQQGMLAQLMAMLQGNQANQNKAINQRLMEQFVFNPGTAGANAKSVDVNQRRSNDELIPLGQGQYHDILSGLNFGTAGVPRVNGQQMLAKASGYNNAGMFSPASDQYAGN